MPLELRSYPVVTQKKQDQSVSLLTMAKDFVKGIPGAIARVFGGSVTEFGTSAGSQFGKSASDYVTKKLGHSIFEGMPGAKTLSSAAKGFQQGLEGGIIPGAKVSTTGFQNPTQALGLFAEAAVDTVTAFTGGSIIKSGIKGLATTEGKSLFKKALLSHVTSDFVTGAASGTAVELQQPEEQRNILGGALTAGAANVVIPRVLGGVTRFGLNAAKTVGSKLGEIADNLVVPELKMIATREARQRAELQASKKFPFVPDTVAPATAFEKGAKLALQAIEGTKDIPTKFSQAFETVFAPVRKITKKLEEKGQTPADLENIFQLTKLSGRISEPKIRDYFEKGHIAMGPEAWSLVKMKTRFLDELDRMAADKNTLPGDMVSMKNKYEEWWNGLSEDSRKLIDEGVQHVNQTMNSMLDEAVSSGRITPEDAARMRAAHPNYMPHQVIFDDIEARDPNPLIDGNKKAFTPGALDFKEAKGSMRPIEDLDVAITKYIATETYKNEKQKAINALLGAVKGSEKEFGFEQLTNREDILKRQSIAHEQVLLGELKDMVEDVLKKFSRSARLLQSEINKLNRQGLKAALRRDYYEEGGTKSVRNNIAAMLSMPKTEYLKERGMIARREAKLEPLLASIDDLRGQYDALKATRKDLWQQSLDLAGKQVETKDIPRGFEKVSLLNQGVKEDWIVPSDVAFMLRAIDPSGMSKVTRLLNSTLWGKVMQAPTKVIRATQVALNPLFMFFRNPPRDIQEAWMANGAFGESYIRSLKEVFGEKFLNQESDVLKLASESGAFVGNILKENDNPKAIAEEVLSKYGLGSKKIIPKAGSVAKEIWTGAGEVFEQATRLTVFKKAIKEGMSPDQAAKAARNATVDFSKSGYVSEVLNKVIPFFNPAVQGTINMATRLGKDPVTFYRRAFNYVVMPTMILHAYNSRSEGYYNISENDRLRNWIIVLGDTTGRDPQTGAPGKRAFYLKIPKGPQQVIISGLVDRVLDEGKNKNEQSWADLSTSLIGNVSPIDFDSALPPFFKTPFELAQNRDFFRQKDITPEWVMDKRGKWVKASEVDPEFRYNERYTSEVAEKIGSALGVSPAQVEYVAQTYGGVFNQMIWMLDLPFQRLTQDGKLEKYSQQLKDKKPTTFENVPIFEDMKSTLPERMANMPFIRSLLNVSQTKDSYAERRTEERKAQEKNRPKFEAKK